MKITLNTQRPDAAASMMYINAMKSIPEVSINDYNYDKYDIALIMTYDHAQIQNIKQKHPNLKVGIVDPRGQGILPSVLHSDFMIIDSIEMEDYWSIANKPMFRYSEYPIMPYLKKKHEDKDKIVIGYHGNMIHLDCMATTVTPALSDLGKNYNIQLMVMYNGNPPSGKEMWIPKNCSIKHVWWSMDNYVNELAKSDIGIAPNNMIHDTSTKHLTKTEHRFNFSEDDYSLRFKMPSNPGRFLVFGKLNIPVVADFYPSALQLLRGDEGFVAHNPQGWKYNLERLIKSSSLRQSVGDCLQKLVVEKFDFDVQNKSLLTFLKETVL